MPSVPLLNLASSPRCLPLAALGSSLRALWQTFKADLGKTSPKTSRKTCRKSFKKGFKRRITGLFCANCELQVIKFSNDTQAWWYAYDPQTQQHIYAATEEELERWIEAQYQGSSVRRSR